MRMPALFDACSSSRFKAQQRLMPEMEVLQCFSGESL